jgi:hypothetical protein
METIELDITKLSHVRFLYQEDLFVAILVDSKDFPILRGYGKTKTEALNDLHFNLL